MTSLPGYRNVVARPLRFASELFARKPQVRSLCQLVMGRSSDTTAEIRRQVVHLSAKGLSTRAIASIIAANQSTVSRILKRHRETGSVEKKPRCGRPRKSTPRDDRHLKALSLANRFKTARQLRDEWSVDSAVDVSARTIRRRLLSAGLRGCVAVKKPFISARNKKKRLQFARNHRNWTVDDWSRALWSDESKFNMKAGLPTRPIYRTPSDFLPALRLHVRPISPLSEK